MRNTPHKGIGMTKFFKLAVIGTMAVGASTVMGAQPQALTQLGISGSEPGVIRTDCSVYDVGKNLVDGVVLDAYNEPFIDEEGIRKNLAVIKCALPKPPKKPRHDQPTSTEDQVLLNYGNIGNNMMCLSPKAIIEKIDEVKDVEGNIITEEEDAVLTNYQLTEDWQNIVSASGEISLVCKHITPAVDTEPPVLTLLAFCNDINYTIDKDRQYNIPDYLNPGATAQDDFDGDITAQIIVTGGPVDVSAVKDYTLTYSITDSSSNTATATRVIRVVESTIKVTGQTTSYTTSGDVLVDDCTLKDDGFYQSGIATDFSRAGDTVTDNVTGLIWEDGTHVTDNNPKTSDPEGYCTNLNTLNFGGISTGWRLPDVWELLTIVDKREYDPAIDDSVFQNVFPGSGYTWSKTKVGTTGYQWIVNFTWGLDVSDVTAPNENYGVRCVVGTLPASGKNYTKDSNKIVSNGATGLEWVDNDTTNGATITWEQAIDSCENLTTGGYTDWRLPNINEYYSIYDYAENEISAPFVLSAIHIWSSTSSATGSLSGQSSDRAWVMKQTNGESAPKAKSDLKTFMCVRNQ